MPLSVLLSTPLKINFCRLVSHKLVNLFICPVNESHNRLQEYDHTCKNGNFITGKNIQKEQQ